jgi:hypothetical protein
MEPMPSRNQNRKATLFASSSMVVSPLTESARTAAAMPDNRTRRPQSAVFAARITCSSGTPTIPTKARRPMTPVSPSRWSQKLSTVRCAGLTKSSSVSYSA